MAMKLNMLPPSVNNMSVRVFVRAAGIPVEEENVWGQTQERGVPGRSTRPGSRRRSRRTSCRRASSAKSRAVMMYLATREGRDDLYPSDPKKRAMVDAANFYTLSIFYPLMARATYPRLGFAGLSGRGLDLGRVRRAEGGGAQVRGGLAAEDPRRLPGVLGHGHRLHRGRGHADDRRYQARCHARSSPRPRIPGSPVGRRTTSGRVEVGARRTRTASRLGDVRG